MAILSGMVYASDENSVPCAYQLKQKHSVSLLQPNSLDFTDKEMDLYIDMIKLGIPADKAIEKIKQDVRSAQVITQEDTKYKTEMQQLQTSHPDDFAFWTHSSRENLIDGFAKASQSPISKIIVDIVHHELAISEHYQKNKEQYTSVSQWLAFLYAQRDQIHRDVAKGSIKSSHTTLPYIAEIHSVKGIKSIYTKSK